MKSVGGPAPSIGRVVTYRSKTGAYDCPAIVTATAGTLWPEGVDRGDVPPISSDTHVHLEVLTPGAAGRYQEFDIPFDSTRDAHVPPGTWRWPERV